ncbi:hypothetical protein MHB50_13835 [Siminovitchia sp. FSL H7-0308]
MTGTTKNKEGKVIGMTFKDTKYLHIYAQYMPHHESFIVGNKTALLELKRVIDVALSTGESQGDFSASDGEGYEVIVIKVSDDSMKLFESLEMPYTEQYGEINNHMYFVNETKDNSTPHPPAILLKNKNEDGK